MAALAYLLQAYRLKEEPRSGWALRGIPDGESVADHSWGTALLCLLFADDAGVPRGEAIEMAVVHDLAEAEIGDLPSLADERARPVPEHEKARLEERAMTRLAAAWPGEASGRAMARWRAYERRGDQAALFVRDMNLVDMCLQALAYERDRRYADADASSSDGRGGRLDEFFRSADARISTDMGRSLFEEIRRAYLALRETQAGGDAPGDARDLRFP